MFESSYFEEFSDDVTVVDQLADVEISSMSLSQGFSIPVTDKVSSNDFAYIHLYTLLSAVYIATFSFMC